jgi:hypothetical protein
MSFQETITKTWLRTSRPDQRTLANSRSFYRKMLHNLGAKGIHQAQQTAGGTCLECGEDGRCPGYHYRDEFAQSAIRLPTKTISAEAQELLRPEWEAMHEFIAEIAKPNRTGTPKSNDSE